MSPVPSDVVIVIRPVEQVVPANHARRRQRAPALRESSRNWRLHRCRDRREQFALPLRSSFPGNTFVHNPKESRLSGQLSPSRGKCPDGGRTRGIGLRRPSGSLPSRAGKALAQMVHAAGAQPSRGRRASGSPVSSVMIPVITPPRCNEKSIPSRCSPSASSSNRYRASGRGWSKFCSR